MCCIQTISLESGKMHLRLKLTVQADGPVTAVAGFVTEEKIEGERTCCRPLVKPFEKRIAALNAASGP